MHFTIAACRAALLALGFAALCGCAARPRPIEGLRMASSWPQLVATPFVDPNTSETYPIIDGRVIVECKHAPAWPELDENDFDDPAADHSTYWDNLNAAIVASQCTNAPLNWTGTAALDPYTAADDYEIDQLVQAEDLTVLSYWPALRALCVELPEGTTVEEAMTEWPGDYPALIESVTPDSCGTYLAFPADPPNDEAYPVASDMSNLGQWNLHQLAMPIEHVSTANETFSFADPFFLVKAIPGTFIAIDGSTANDGAWLIQSCTNNGTDTAIKVFGNVTNGLADGQILFADCSLRMGEVWPAYTQSIGDGRPCTVAVLDTGVDWPKSGLMNYGQSDLAARTTTEGCNVNGVLGETCFLPRTDADGSPPYSLGNGRPSQAALDFSEGNAQQLGHGTAVTGVASATVNNDPTPSLGENDIAGTAPYQSYFPVAMDSTVSSELDDEMTMPYRSSFINALFIVALVKGVAGDPGKWLDGVEVLPTHNIEAINISFGWRVGQTHPNRRIEDHLLTVLSRYVVVVAGAGNDHTTDEFFPACHPSVLAVAGHDAFGNLWVTTPETIGKGCNYGSYISISAPGENVYTTDMSGINSNGKNLGYTGGDSTINSGTSVAAPHVTALAGLLADLEPNLTPSEIIDRIIDSATVPVTSDKLGYNSSLYSHIKMVNAYEALYP